MAKTNPRRKPATAADVNKARQNGMDFGVEFAINCILYILKDKHGSEDADIDQLRDEFMYLMDSISKKYVSYADITKTLSGEYDLSVHMVGRH